MPHNQAEARADSLLRYYVRTVHRFGKILKAPPALKPGSSARFRRGSSTVANAQAH
jgi:hypothetical protein